MHFRLSSKISLLPPASLFIKKVNFDIWTENSSPVKSFIEKASRPKKLRKTSKFVHQKLIVVFKSHSSDRIWSFSFLSLSDSLVLFSSIEFVRPDPMKQLNPAPAAFKSALCASQLAPKLHVTFFTSSNITIVKSLLKQVGFS